MGLKNGSNRIMKWQNRGTGFLSYKCTGDVTGKGVRYKPRISATIGRQQFCQSFTTPGNIDDSDAKSNKYKAACAKDIPTWIRLTFLCLEKQLFCFSTRTYIETSVSSSPLPVSQGKIFFKTTT